MLERTIIYVDTSYLLASFYNTWATGARAQLEIDLPEVVNVLESRAVNQLNQPVHRQNWYDGIPDSGPHRYQRALRSCPGVQLRAGQLIEWGDRRTQKAVDTRLVADMVISAAHGDVTDIILVSGDADMLPGVEESVARGVRVHLYGFGWDSMSSNLRYACDTTTILDPREHFGDCMRLEVLEGPLKAGGSTDQADGTDSAEPGEDSGVEDAPDAPDAAENTAKAAGKDAGKDAEGVAHKPIGDAEPVEDLSGTSAVPDVRRRSKNSSSSVPSPADLANGGPLPSSTSSPAPAAEPADPSEPTKPVTPTQGSETSGPSGPADPVDQQDAGDCDGAEEAAAAGAAAAEPVSSTNTADAADTTAPKPTPGRPTPGTARPTPAMMASRRRLRNRYVPLPTEIWQSGGQQSTFDIGEQYAIWWYHNAIDEDQRSQAHTYTGGGLPPEINRPLLQFACETLHEYTLTESQRVNLRDGFHSGIRGIIMKKS